MIEIIGQVKKEATCAYCGAVLSYQHEDIEYEEVSYDRIYYYIVCPQCGDRVYVPKPPERNKNTE